MITLCYACECEATSREHIPPLSIFPKEKDFPSSESFRQNLITVPACEAHNMRKSKDDEYLMMILVAHFANNEVANQQMRTKVIRAWSRRPHLALTAIKDPTPGRLNGQETMMFRVDLDRFNRAMELITRGLIFKATEIRWPGAFKVWETNMLPSDADSAAEIIDTSNKIKDAMEILFSSAPFQGENPKVFKYQLHVPTPPDTIGCARLVFYEGLEIAIFFGPAA